jgi:hypothetical protein
MHPELDRQKRAVMKIPRRALGCDVAAFSLVMAIRLERAAG